MFRLRKSQSLGLRLLLSESVFWFLLLLLLTVTVCRSQDVSFYDIEMNDIYGNKPLYKFLKGEYTDDVINCHDDHKDCDFWAGDGECQKNPEYMLKSCRLACKECVCAYPFAGPIKWNFEYFLIGRNGKVNERWPTGEYMIIMI
mmetsp:Transcript_22942/g.28146  ORF Transcript_22942/g.28146 Transcript_22942/m.28146 type:complete len:144 (+) Transcript_22942:153-584(+)